MTIIESITLLGIMMTLAAIPSTSVALVVTRSAMFGVGNGLAVSAGIILGDLVFIALAILGLTVISGTVAIVLIIIKVIGGLYLLWFGYSLITTSSSTDISVKQSGGKVIYAILADKVTTYTKYSNMENPARKAAGLLMIGTGGYLIVKS